MRGVIEVIKGKSFASLAGNGMSALLGVLSFALLARFLSKADFGTWILFIAVYGIFDTLRLGMILNALVRNLARVDEEEEKKKVIGSSLMLTLLLTLSFCMLITLAWFVMWKFGLMQEHLYLLKWYALIALLTLPHNFAGWFLNAGLHIKTMSFIRIFNQLIFIGIFLSWTNFRDSLDVAFYSSALAHFFTSLLCIITGWAQLRLLFHYTRKYLSDIFHFGKFSMGTLLGSNLLKSSDTFLINTFLSSLQVAAYNVPMRFIEIVEMPLRSFAVTALPQYARLFAANEMEALKHAYARRTGLIFFLLLPLSVICFFFARPIVEVLGGRAYADSAILLRLFSIYTALSPIDKFSGVMLDIINKPYINFVKVLLMLGVNVVGDIVCLKVFGTLESVAIVSTMTFLTGVTFAYYYLHKDIGLQLKLVFIDGFDELKIRIQQVAYGRRD